MKFIQVTLLKSTFKKIHTKQVKQAKQFQKMLILAIFEHKNQFLTNFLAHCNMLQKQLESAWKNQPIHVIYKYVKRLLQDIMEP